MGRIPHNRKVAVVGLGYVGLPVAIAFGKKDRTIGFDINRRRVEELSQRYDATGEVASDELENADIEFTTDSSDLTEADFFIVTVPTPINKAKQPELTPLFHASEMVAAVLKKGDIVVYESTVYPGVTEEECLPILESVSKLKAGLDFKVGYSPERINPGDKEHTFTKILKIVSGQDREALDIIARVYGSVVTAGIYKASSIKVAEAAKVIENCQRDINIGFVNELAVVFDKLGINTHDVLEAAGTKWNFLPFKPGLVGGHCIGVDPYYLTHRAEEVGYNPQVILAGRRTNDSMGKFIAQKTVKEMVQVGHQTLGSTVTILGLTFKENCPDCRNSRVIDIINELKEFNVNIQVHDEWANKTEAKRDYDISLQSYEELLPAHALIVAVAHDLYRELTQDNFNSLIVENGVLIDVKGVLSIKLLKNCNIRSWKL